MENYPHQQMARVKTTQAADPKSLLVEVCAVEQVDSGRAVSPKTVASALSARDDDRTTRIVESGSVLFCCRSYPLVALCGEHPTGCGKWNPCANSAWEW
jgi:hypothetical protein